MRQQDYAERVYAGVLGKIIGVYLGRPVEGWDYLDIQHRFGLVDRYVNADVGAPLIVADDDISGTFTFARAVLDTASSKIQPSDIGRAWLNYIIEDRTILWWGGYGRSTEHTAYLNLRRGVPPPRSGSIEQNGSTLAEQIGAQIFSDAFALMTPGDPEQAVALTRAAASVSHDGDALESASLLAAMRALAFEEPRLDVLLDQALDHVSSARVLALAYDVRSNCPLGQDWRRVRNWVDVHYGYARYPGPCHSLSNLAMSLAALLTAGDDFRRSVAIAASVGFDTDSNAGTVGCLNGVRLGLPAVDAAPDLRRPVADRLLVVSADGGECVSDAVRETEKILDAHNLLSGRQVKSRPRFHFGLPGSVQGFSACPHLHGSRAELTNIATRSGRALAIQQPVIDRRGPGCETLTTSVSTPTFLDPIDAAVNFTTVASPTLYPGQTVSFRFAGGADNLQVRPYVLTAAVQGVDASYGPSWTVPAKGGDYTWTVPPAGSNIPFRLGLTISWPPGPPDNLLLVERITWSEAPNEFTQSGVLLSSIWDTAPQALNAWVNSAKNFEADFGVTYSVSHPDTLGLVTIGTRDWRDYRVASRVTFLLHDTAGLAARSRGHRRFVAGALSNGDQALLLQQDDERRTILATCPFPYERDREYLLELHCEEAQVSLLVDELPLLTAETTHRSGGGAGFLVENGTMLADGFHVTSIPSSRTRPHERQPT